MWCTRVLCHRWREGLPPHPPATQNHSVASGVWGVGLCHRADMSAVSHHNRHVCCVTQQTCLLNHTADKSAVSHSRHGCCVARQTCLPCRTGPFPENGITFLPRTAKYNIFRNYLMLGSIACLRFWVDCDDASRKKQRIPKFWADFHPTSLGC